MNIWRLLMVSSALMALGGLFYLLTRFRRFSFIRVLSVRNRALPWLAAAVPLLLISLFRLINVTTLVVVLIHLTVIWLLCDIAAFLFRRISKKQFDFDAQNWIALILTVLYLGVGWHNAHHVRRTFYELETDKDLGGQMLHIVLFADSHLGITLDGDSFAREMERIQAEQPDVVFLAGDFVDDDSCKADMLAACEALGRLQTKYGVYFIYGNHDNGYFQYRDFTSAELRQALTDNHVTILDDETITVGDLFQVVGRRDRSMAGHKPIAQLIDGPSDLYTIVLDHQPNDYDNEAAAPVDLVLSGHTHGGHLFPIGPISIRLGMNDLVYGTEKRGDVTFLVTSGISGWAIPFKTGTFSEYVVIDIAER